ncbi:MAG: LTA synthase family protein [Opitutaceae bacterium]|nr:LTA synthase family protein [Opitutaceae bacterium]
MAALFVTISTATRLALMCRSFDLLDWSASLLASLGWGLLFDLGAAAWLALPLILILAALPNRVFAARSGRAAIHTAMVVLAGIAVFGSVAEWFFWDEFGARFNFIAVDYLVYTTEVLGNIRESYPMPLILGGVAVVTVALHLWTVRQGLVRHWLDHAAAPARRRWRAALAAAALCLAPALGLRLEQLPEFANNYNREIAQNGPWSLFAAFHANQLDFDRFYAAMPSAAAFRRINEMLTRDGSVTRATGAPDTLRQVTSPGPEIHPNIIQITVESLSARFLTRYGSPDGLTPNLDALIPQSLVFDQFYATGNRTDRGMESLTLSIPPTPGRSLVKRPHNEDLFTLGSVLRTRDYQTAFIYGGYGYFDNMNHFFGANGYRVVDRTMVGRDDITFANVWGACDEDLLRWTLREADRDFAAGKPFFHFVMTTSNHRPYTFPDGRIDLPSKEAGRKGGVKYTDHAIGEFLRAAATKPWYKNTVFVIVADHCASSAGKASLPVENYHIPLIIFAPGGQVKPGAVATLASQIDYAPTLLGLLGWSYESRFFGSDVLRLDPARPGRALLATYQKLGLLRGGELGVLSPPRAFETFYYSASDDLLHPRQADEALENDAIAYYQTASELYKAGRYRALPAPR